MSLSALECGLGTIVPLVGPLGVGVPTHSSGGIPGCLSYGGCATLYDA